MDCNVLEHVLGILADKQATTCIKRGQRVTDQTEHVRQRKHQEVSLLKYLLVAVAAVLDAVHDGSVRELCTLALARGATGKDDGGKAIGRRIDGRGCFGSGCGGVDQRQCGILLANDGQTCFQRLIVRNSLETEQHGATEHGHGIQVRGQQHRRRTVGIDGKISLDKSDRIGSKDANGVALLDTCVFQHGSVRCNLGIQLGEGIVLTVDNGAVAAIGLDRVLPHFREVGKVHDLFKGFLARILFKHSRIHHFQLSFLSSAAPGQTLV